MTATATPTAVSAATHEEREELRAAVGAFLARNGGVDRLRTAVDTGELHDDVAWRAMADDLGLPGIGVPEDLGGAGYGFADLAVVLEELGGALYPSPLLAGRVLAGELLMALLPDAADPGVVREALGRLATGTATGTADLGDPGLVARTAPDGGVVVVDGIVAPVVDGARADLLLLGATLDGAPAVVLVEASAPGLTRTPMRTLDLTRELATVSCDGTPARVLASGPAAVAARSDAWRRAAIAMAAEQIGGAARCLAMAVEHARGRIQFGRPIGSFQAVKHRLAEVLLEVDAGQAAVTHAARAVDAGSPDLALLAPLVLAHTSEAYIAAAAACIQVHGGMGFTWEHPAHLYYRRARSTALILGSPDRLRDQLARTLSEEKP
jgi:alkylation response protein AidB-like acyl-CoA dehydrogenase